MNIDKLSGQELDALAATSVMGWELRIGPMTERGKPADTWYGKGGAHLWAGYSNFHPSEGKELNHAANLVLLKALGEGLIVEVEQIGSSYGVIVRHHLVRYTAAAPTLPTALIRAICKAVKQ